MADTPDLGPHTPIISSIYEFTQQALEELSQWIEGRGLRTPVGNIVGYQADRLAARLTRTTTQSINDVTETALQWDSVDFDTSKMFDSGANTKLTAAIDGIYYVSVGAAWDTNATGQRTIFVKQNGAKRAGNTAPASANTWVDASTFVHMAAGDYVEASVFQNSGGARTVSGVTETHLSATLINRYKTS